MANDLSITDIDSLALDNVTGGRFIVPGGGGSGQTTMNIPGGGSLSCPAGTAPHHTDVKGNGSATFSEGGGLSSFKLTGNVHYQDDRCDPIRKK